MSVNDDVLDRSIRHAIALQRARTAEVVAILDLLQTQVFPDIMRVLERDLPSIKSRGMTGRLTPFQTKRYKAMADSLSSVIREGYKRILGDRLTPDLMTMATGEVAWQTRMLSATVPINVSWDEPSVGVLRQIVTGRPFGAGTQSAQLSAWWNGLTARAQEDILSTINSGLATGQTTAEITRRLRGTERERFADGTFGKLRRNAETVVRTAATHATTGAREELYRENRDVIRGVMYVATLDTRTTKVCADLDGDVFEIDEGPRPPQHPNCRSTTTPVVKSLDDIGISGRDLTPAERASMDGQVPGKLTYYEWLERQPASVQDEALGPTRGRMFRRGEVKPDKFVERTTGRTRTVAELVEMG